MPEERRIKIKGQWLAVRHTEDQQHPDWVLYLDDDAAALKAGKGQQPRAIAQCERQSSGKWWWTVDDDQYGQSTGVEASADLAMEAANAFIRERMKEEGAK